MRYPREYKTAARSRILDRGGRHAKKHGFRASGMDALAAAAGVTTGALYKQFAGKSDFFVALLEAELRRTEERFAGVPSADSQAIDQVQADYLSLQHVRTPERGCLLPSLTPRSREPSLRLALRTSRACGGSTPSSKGGPARVTRRGR